MKSRIQVGTDVAMIGAWDKGVADLSVTKHEGLHKSLEQDAAAGILFLVNTGADCGGAVDVYIDAEVQARLGQQITRVGGEYLLSVPTGELVLGGAEDYRSGNPQITSADSAVVVPASDYAVTCFEVTPGDDEPDPHAILEQSVGADDAAYFGKMNNAQGLFGCSSLLFFPVLAYLWNWMAALPITGVIFILSFNLSAKLLSRNQRYQNLCERYSDALIEAESRESPFLILELRRISSRENLKGGSVDLSNPIGD
jgi:hypothetical protein